MRERFNHNWDDYAHTIGYQNERDMLTDMYVRQGLSLAQIASRLQCGTFTINRHLDALNINKRGRGGCNASSFQTRKLFYIDQRVVHAHNLGKLATLTGISSSLIYKYRRLITRLPENMQWNSQSSAQSQDSNDTQV